MQTVVSNTSPIIILAKTNQLHLFQTLFDEVLIPPTVYTEIIEKNDTASERLKTAQFIKVKAINPSETLQNLYSILDKGEAEAIALAKELDVLLIIDERKGRNVAKKINLKMIGFLGVLYLNYQKGQLTKEEILEIIQQAETFDYRLGEHLKANFLKNLSDFEITNT